MSGTETDAPVHVIGFIVLGFHFSMNHPPALL